MKRAGRFGPSLKRERLDATEFLPRRSKRTIVLGAKISC